MNISIRREYRREILLWILRRYFYLDLFWGCAATLILRKSVNELLGNPYIKSIQNRYAQTTKSTKQKSGVYVQ